MCGARALPEAFLGWVVEGRAGDLLDGHPARRRARARAARLAQVTARNLAAASAIARVGIDTTIDLQCLTKSAIAAWLSGGGGSAKVAAIAAS